MIRNATTRDNIETYCEAVLAGDIVACELVVKAVEKFCDELERSASADIDFPFSFIWEEAEDCCEIFPSLLRHSKGEWAGKPFELSPWQMFIIANIYGWKRQDGTRRFRKAFISVARKNGKTSVCAGLELLMLFLDTEAGAEVYIGATKIDQAKLIHDEAERMLRQSPHIAQHAEIFKNNITFPANNGFARPLGSDKPFDGLNPSAVFFDEVHAWKEQHRDFFNTMITGSGSRTQPLQVIITTAGDNRSQIYHEEAEYARSVIKGDFVDDSVFAMIFELDKTDDPFAEDFELETMRKANPGLGVSVKEDYLHQQLIEAKNKPQAKNRFVRYHANRCVSSVEEAITAEIWDAMAGEMSDWMLADGVGAGVDIGGRDDLAAYAMTAKFKTGEDKEERPIYRYESKSVAFIASDTKRDLLAQPFAQWITDGKLIVCDYVISTLKERLIEDCQKYGIELVAYDPYQATQLAEDLENEGITPVKMAQNHTQFNETMASYQQEISEGRFMPDESDVVLRWCALNMAVNRDSKDRIMPDKKHSKEKIDAAVAMLMSKRACTQSLPRQTGSLVL